MFDKNSTNSDDVKFCHPKTGNDNYDLGKTIASNLMAGLAVSTLFFPLESLKKVLQQGEKFNLSYNQIYRQLRATGQVAGYVPYRGLPVFALNIIPTTFIQLTVEKALEEYIPSDSSNAMLVLRALTSGAIGAVTATIVENTITRQQVLKTDFIPTLKEMWKVSPARMFKTYPLIAIRDAIFTLNLFFVHPKIEKYLKENQSDSVLSTRYISAIPLAIFGAVFSHPFDTLATNLQKTHEKSNYLKALNQLVKNDLGFRSLYRGLQARIPLFYGFIVVIPGVRNRCEAFIDRNFGTDESKKVSEDKKNLLSNQSFFQKDSDSEIGSQNDDDNKFYPPKS